MDKDSIQRDVFGLVSSFEELIDADWDDMPEVGYLRREIEEYANRLGVGRDDDGYPVILQEF